MKTLNSILFSLMAITIVFLSSCEKGEETITESQNQFSDADYLRIKDAICSSIDECEEHVVFTDNEIIIDGCLTYNNEHYLNNLNRPQEPESVKIPHPNNQGEMIEIDNSSLEERQRLIDGTVFLSNTYAGNIKYWVRPSASNSSCNDGYNTTIVATAIDRINGINGCGLNFVIADNENDADIVIACDSDDEEAWWESVGFAHYHDLPANRSGRTHGAYYSNSEGRIITGQYISLNGDYGDPSIRDRTLTHELLHTVGIGHTNDTGHDHVAGTSTWDNGSLMNNGWTATGLSFNDKKLLRLVWPDYLVAPNITNVWVDATDKVVIAYKNPDWINRPYQRLTFWCGSGSGWYSKTIEGSGISTGNGRFYYKIPMSQLGGGYGNRNIAIYAGSYNYELIKYSNWSSVYFPAPES